jgi:hypothetical protein
VPPYILILLRVAESSRSFHLLSLASRAFAASLDLFAVNVLENSIPQGREYLKSLSIFDSSDISMAGTVNYAQLSTSLIRVIEVLISLSLMNRHLLE